LRLMEAMPRLAAVPSTAALMADRMAPSTDPPRRHVTAAEYRAAAEYMENCGIVDGFVQERTSAREEYTPAFDLTGV